MKVNVTVNRPGLSMSLFDMLYAYWQSNDKNYQTKNQITFGDQPITDAINIWFDYLPESFDLDKIKEYDLVMLCNGCEPVQVSTPAIKKAMEHAKVYLAANSYLSRAHALYHKVIWCPHNFIMCNDLWFDHRYPQFFEKTKYIKSDRSPELLAINGANRAHRHHFFSELSRKVPSISVRSNLSSGIFKIDDCQWESANDQIFRDWCNDSYYDDINPKSYDYYDRSALIGIDGKLGAIAPGYTIMPEYFEYSCVIFPESNWINDELCVTEKAFKCFRAGSLPFPVAGAGTNRMYNELGFYTAWNLLPRDLQRFDWEPDHRSRYDQMIDAISWLENNQEIFSQDVFRDLTLKNKIHFLDNDCVFHAIKRFDHLLSGYQKS